MREQKINRREILKTLVMLSIPTILEEILSTLLQYVDTAMVGHLGEKATASVSVTTTVTWLVNSIPYTSFPDSSISMSLSYSINRLVFLTFFTV